MSRITLSSVDTAWLRMEDPANLMMITGVMILSTPVSFRRVQATIDCRLLSFDRFKQRVVQPRLPLAMPAWEADPDFKLDNHVKVARLPGLAGHAELQDLVSELMSTPLDYNRPLWQMHLVENYAGGSALICRLHHCIADGIALMQVLLSLADKEADAPWPSPPSHPRPRRHASLIEQKLEPARVALKRTAQVTEALLHEGTEALVDPEHARSLARLGKENALALARLVLRWPDPKTVFKGKLHVPKLAAWSAPIALDDVKKVGKALGGTVNDVLLTAVTGALRRYLESRNEPVDGLNFRAIVPVNLRPPDAPLELGNKFSLVFLSLPVGIAEPVDRLIELKRRMDELKHSAEPGVAFGILNAIGMTPTEIQNIVVNIFGSKGTGVMTNVPGPREQLYLAGAPLDTIMFWVPQSGRLGLGVSIISYANRVSLGIATDKNLVPDPDVIVQGFHTEFQDMLQSITRTEKRRHRAVRPMIDMLDEAMQVMDQTIENTRKAEQCQGLTKAGQPCKHRRAAGSIYCTAHQTQQAAPAKAKPKPAASSPTRRKPTAKASAPHKPAARKPRAKMPVAIQPINLPAPEPIPSLLVEQPADSPARLPLAAQSGQTKMPIQAKGTE